MEVVEIVEVDVVVGVKVEAGAAVTAGGGSFIGDALGDVIDAKSLPTLGR